MSCLRFVYGFLSPWPFRSLLATAAASLFALSLAVGPSAARAEDAPDKPAAEKNADADNKDDTGKKDDAKKDDAKKDDTEPAELPDPEPVSDLVTDDNLELQATYFPGTKRQESIPVIIIHGLGPKCNRKDFDQADGLAHYLQAKLGCAVIVPDLRGHGESTKWTEKYQKDLRLAHKRLPPAPKADSLRPADRAAMVELDLLAVKEFLWKKNNDKELNLDKLVVIGVEEGAALAVNYAYFDAKGYNSGRAKYGPLKLGKFVKGVILISPQMKVPGLKTAQILRDPEFCATLPVMIVAGRQNAMYFSEAEKLNKEFSKERTKPAEARPEDMTVWFYKKIDTKLQGTKLLAEPSVDITGKIGAFIKARLVKNPDAKEWVWKERKMPFE